LETAGVGQGSFASVTVKPSLQHNRREWPYLPGGEFHFKNLNDIKAWVALLGLSTFVDFWSWAIHGGGYAP
jgi:hypothetical protein